MKKERNSLSNRIVSFVLAAVMMLSVIAVIGPETVSAAEFSINGSGSVTITDLDTYNAYYANEDQWIKYTAPKSGNGYVKFTIECASDMGLDNYSDGTWCLFDRNKKQISTIDKFDTSQTASYFKSIIFGVQKGKTYYLRVDNYPGVKVTAKFTKVTEKSGASKKKAVNIKKGKTVKGTILAGSKTADWYKFKLTKDQYVKISYSAKTNRGIRFTVYNGSKSIGSVSQSYASEKTSSQYIVNARTNKKLKVKKGTTYYVKVERYDTNSSGYYTFKWN